MTTSWQMPQQLWDLPQPMQSALMRIFQSQQEFWGTKLQAAGDPSNITTALVSANSFYSFGTNYQFSLAPALADGQPDANWGLSVDFSANYGTVDQKTIMHYASGNVNRVCGVYDHRIGGFIYWADNAANPIVRAAWTVASSEEVKDNITTLTPTTIAATSPTDAVTALGQLCQLRPVSFNYKDDSASDKLRYGFIAEEVINVFPDLVAPLTGKTPMGLSYDGLIPVIVHALSEIQARITTLEGKSGIVTTPGIGKPPT